jgi:hypothetical protein
MMMMGGSFTEDGWKVEGITFVEDATSDDEAIYSWGTTVSHCAPATWPACGIRCCCQVYKLFQEKKYTNVPLIQLSVRRNDY